jgi:hypothetical protein
MWKELHVPNMRCPCKQHGEAVDIQSEPASQRQVMELFRCIENRLCVPLLKFSPLCRPSLAGLSDCDRSVYPGELQSIDIQACASDEATPGEKPIGA